MTAPNLVNPASVYGKTASVNLTTTAATLLLDNAAASNKALKVNTLIVSNVNPTTSAVITILTYSAATLGGTATEICSGIIVPAGASLIVTDKTTTFYMVENTSLAATAGTSNYLKVTVSYEEIM